MGIPIEYQSQELPEDWAPVESLEIHTFGITDGLTDLTAVAEAFRHQADLIDNLRQEGWVLVSAARGALCVEREA